LGCWQPQPMRLARAAAMVSAFMPIFSDGASGDAKALRNVVVAYVGWRFSDRGNLVGM